MAPGPGNKFSLWLRDDCNNTGFSHFQNCTMSFTESFSELFASQITGLLQRLKAISQMVPSVVTLTWFSNTKHGKTRRAEIDSQPQYVTNLVTYKAKKGTERLGPTGLKFWSMSTRTDSRRELVRKKNQRTTVEIFQRFPFDKSILKIAFTHRPWPKTSPVSSSRYSPPPQSSFDSWCWCHLSSSSLPR